MHKHLKLMCPIVESLFDHEKLDVYCLELEFVAWIADFFDDALSVFGSASP